MGTFPALTITALVDSPVEYDLGESTSRALRLRDVADQELMDRLLDAPLDYGTSRGGGDLRRAIGAVEGADPEHVVVTAGGISALFLVMQVCCEPGDNIVVVTPSFPPVLGVPEGLGLVVRRVRLSFDGGYRLDVEAVARALTSDTRLVCLASPQNPSGVRFDLAELRALVELVGEVSPQALVVVDEVYRMAGYGDGAPIASAATLRKPTVVTLSSMSKAYGLAGLRIGWVTCSDPALAERLRLGKFHLSISCPLWNEQVAAHVLNRSAEVLADRNRELGRARTVLADWVAEHSELLEWVPPQAGALCCLRLRPTRYASGSAEAFHSELAVRGTRVAPGPWFGDAENVFRLGFGHLDRAAFPRALDRVAESLRSVR